MDLWIKVLVLQAIIAICGVVAGRVVFGLSYASAWLAVGLITPVPLFKISPGAAGFVYTADIISLGYFLTCLAKGRQREGPFQMDSTERKLVFLSVFLLLLWPIASTLAGAVSMDVSRNWKVLALSFARGIGYVSIFHLFIQRAKAEDRPDSFLGLQCLAFTLISLCGIMQYFGGFETDFWNSMRGIEIGKIGTVKVSTGFEAGFMGLYRGAVGAWAAGIVGVIPLAFGRHKSSPLIIPVLTSIVLLAVAASGSRQGIAVGGFSFVLGLFLSVRLMPRGSRLAAFARGGAGVAILAIAGLLIWSHYSSLDFREFIGRRYDFGSSVGDAVDMAVHRDPHFPVVIDGLKNSGRIFTIGSGYGIENDPSGVLADTTGFIYVDSEILTIWQMGGLVQIAAYAYLILCLRSRMRKKNWPSDAGNRAAISSGIVILYGGVLLMYGHFFIANIFPHEAPIAYWTWCVLGLATGCAVPRQSAEEHHSMAEDSREVVLAQ